MTTTRRPCCFLLLCSWALLSTNNVPAAGSRSLLVSSAPTPATEPPPVTGNTCAPAATAMDKNNSSSSPLPLPCPVVVHDDGSSSMSMCVDKVSADQYDGMVPMLDGSGRSILWNNRGFISLGSSAGSGALRVQPFIDLSSHVFLDVPRGIGGLIAVAHGVGRGSIFASYTTVMGAQRYVCLLVVEISMAAQPQIVGRVAAISIMAPSAQGPDLFGGQIFFRPDDPASDLYLVAGPTTGEFSPPSQTGAIVRLHAGGMQGRITADVMASSLGIPRRCAFDSQRPQDLYCAGIQAQNKERVLLITDSGVPSATTAVVVALEPAQDAATSIVGGLLYRGSVDNSLIGSYIYLHDSAVWAAVESPARSRHYTATQIPSPGCSKSTPLPCRSGGIAGGVTSFGEDGNKDAFLLATDGVYRIVQPGLCDADARAQAPAMAPAPTRTKWVVPLVGSVLSALSATIGLVAYKKFKCCSQNNCFSFNNNKMESSAR